MKTAEKSNKTAFHSHSTGADLFENITFAVATLPRFLNVVERKWSATRRCVNTDSVNVLLRFRYQSVSMRPALWHVIRNGKLSIFWEASNDRFHGNFGKYGTDIATNEQ